MEAAQPYQLAGSSLVGRVELKKFGSPFLPLGARGRSALALVAAKVLNVALSGLNHMPITSD